MPPRQSRANRSPESGYKFDCDHCEGEIFQGPPPELVIAVEEYGSGRNKGYQSVCYQSCAECAAEIKVENAKMDKKRKSEVRQVIPLRDNQTLTSVLPPAPPATPSAADAKLDKLIEIMTGLTQIMLAGGASSAQVAQAIIAPPEATIPQPKRKILAPPVAKSAKSQAKKPARAQAKASIKKSIRG